MRAFLLTDAASVKPTQANVLRHLALLSQAGRYDLVVLFLAGQGVSDAVLRTEGGAEAARVITMRDLKTVLDLPMRKLILLDVTHAELSAGAKVRPLDGDRLVKDLQEFNAVVFTAARGRELSQEYERWGHGAFGFALANGLGDEGKGDLSKDRLVTVRELETYVSNAVPIMTNGAQSPLTYTPASYGDLPLAAAD